MCIMKGRILCSYQYIMKGRILCSLGMLNVKLPVPKCFLAPKRCKSAVLYRNSPPESRVEIVSVSH